MYRQIALQLVRQGVISESAVAGEVEAKSEETSSDEETDESAADSGVKHEGSAKGAVRVMLSFLEVSFYLFIYYFFGSETELSYDLLISTIMDLSC